MKDKFRFPFIYPGRAISGKNSTLLQIIIVLSSSILSSSAIATVAKAWLDNRKTKLTIEIDDSKKTLRYEGHHLNQDAATIQSMLGVLSKETTITTSVDVVTINMTDDGQKEAYRLTAGNHEKDIIHDANEQAPALQLISRLKRLLPGWLHKESAAT
jgi:hypothetical protein